MTKVAFHTLGCKLNYSETSTLKRSLQNGDFKVVDFSKKSDVYVINTCSVTDQADKKCRHAIRRSLRKNEHAFIVIVGCYAQLKPKEISEIPGVDVVLGAAEKFQLVDYLKDLTKKEKGIFHACEINEVNSFHHSHSFGDRTRAFLKVQDGCDYSCTFCTIPLARGKSRSSTVSDVVNEAEKLSKQDVKEIVLTGVNTGDFGKGSVGGKKRNETFLELIQSLDEVEGIERFRISSIEPNLLTDEIIQFVNESKRFVPHFHVPLQSGSDVILKRMKRRYLQEVYSSRVSAIKSLMREACIGVDVIVGFPGETNDLFLETYNYLNELDVSYLHVFTYSSRPNTVAASMENHVPVEVKRERSEMLRILSEKKKRRFYELWTGGAKRVLVEAETDGMSLYGFTDNYIKVEIPFDKSLINEFVEVTPTSINSNGIMTVNLLPTFQTV